MNRTNIVRPDAFSSGPRVGMVLAAGLGKRMRPLTKHRPKPLIEVHGQSLIDHALDALVRSGVERAIVNVHYLADQIEEHLSKLLRRHRSLNNSGNAIDKSFRVQNKTQFLIHPRIEWKDGHGDIEFFIAVRIPF